jgi:hypothetical protein
LLKNEKHRQRHSISTKTMIQSEWKIFAILIMVWKTFFLRRLHLSSEAKASLSYENGAPFIK